MLIVADVHGAVDALRRAAAEPGPLLVLGDLINFIDYRTFDGMISDLAGKEFVRELVRLRTAGDYAAAGAAWRRFAGGREDEIRARYDVLVEDAYVAICSALVDATGFVTYGNVDRPDVLRRHLPAGMRFMDGETVEIDGLLVGFAGGGVESPLGVAGEVSDAEMRDKLARLGDVDVLCTHVPPLVPALARDVIGGREKGSAAVREFILEMRPSVHYFGDIHQPRAVRWRLGETVCRNVGYFRATGKGIRHG